MKKYVCEIWEKATDKPICKRYFDTKAEAIECGERAKRELEANFDYAEANYFVSLADDEN